MPGTTTTVNAVSSSGVVVTLEMMILGLGLTATEINPLNAEVILFMAVY